MNQIIMIVRGNKKLFIRFKYLFFALAIFLFLFIPDVGLAIGVSPALIEAENILPGSSIIKEVHISRADPFSSLEVQITITGSAANNILLKHGEVIEFPKGEEVFVYPFVIQTKDLLPGIYEAALTVNPTSQAEGEVEKETEILAGAQAEIRFSVTNEEIESYTIQDVEIKDVEENQAVGFSYLMVNTGNIDTRPAKVDFSVTDETNSANSYSETVKGIELPLVPAFQTKQVDVATGALLSAGIYSTKIIFYDDNVQEVSTHDSIRLQVLPLKSEEGGQNIWQNQWLIIAIGILLLLIIIIGRLLWQKK